MRCPSAIRPIIASLLLVGAAGPVAAVTLDEALAAALASNPSIVEADAKLRAAQARVAQADGAMLPTATLSGTYGAGRLDPKGYFGLQAADVNPRAALASLEQPLFSGGRILAGREAARAARSSAEAMAELSRAQISVEVAAGYAAVATTRREVEMRHAQLAHPARAAQREPAPAELRLDPAHRLWLQASAAPAADLLAPAAAEKGLEIGASLDHLLPARVVGDPDRIRQVLMNLADNAVKFTGRGAVEQVRAMLAEGQL